MSYVAFAIFATFCTKTFYSTYRIFKINILVKMKKFITLLFFLFLCGTTVLSQNKKDVLMTIDGSPVYADEFKRVYKKNLDLVQDESQKDIDGYLQLFIDYKLKIAEAKAQDLDQEELYKTEFNK